MTIPHLLISILLLLCDLQFALAKNVHPTSIGEAKAAELAKKNLARLIKVGQIHTHWNEANLVTIVQTEIRQKNLWKIEFQSKNSPGKNSSLLMFLALNGTFISVENPDQSPVIDQNRRQNTTNVSPKWKLRHGINFGIGYLSSRGAIASIGYQPYSEHSNLGGGGAGVRIGGSASGDATFELATDLSLVGLSGGFSLGVRQAKDGRVSPLFSVEAGFHYFHLYVEHFNESVNVGVVVRFFSK